MSLRNGIRKWERETKKWVMVMKMEAFVTEVGVGIIFKSKVNVKRIV